MSGAFLHVVIAAMPNLEFDDSATAVCRLMPPFQIVITRLKYR